MKDDNDIFGGKNRGKDDDELKKLIDDLKKNIGELEDAMTDLFNEISSVKDGSMSIEIVDNGTVIGKKTVSFDKKNPDLVNIVEEMNGEVKTSQIPHNGKTLLNIMANLVERDEALSPGISPAPETPKRDKPSKLPKKGGNFDL